MYGNSLAFAHQAYLFRANATFLIYTDEHILATKNKARTLMCVGGRLLCDSDSEFR